MKNLFSQTLPGIALGTAILLLAPAVKAGLVYNFQTLNNNADPAFNQLLGVNNAMTLAGYFGDGNIVPNKGYTVVPPYSQGSYTNENYPNSAQTQVVGINNGGNPTTIGFYI